MTEKYEEDENLQEAEYHKKSDYSQANQVKEAVDKIKESRGKEMRAGYFNITTQPDGSIKKEYVGDTRKEYASSVEYLKSLLSNEIATSERARKVIKEFKKRKKKCFDEYSVNLQIIQNERVINCDKKYIPEINSSFFQGVEHGNRRDSSTWISVDEIPNIYNPQIKMYWDEMIEVYDYLFQRLNNLIAEKNYFKNKAGF